jgi:hypothetical protein
MEKNLPTETASLDVLGLAEECPGCRVNSFALQGYLEAKAATNNFEKGMQRQVHWNVCHCPCGAGS